MVVHHFEARGLKGDQTVEPKELLRAQGKETQLESAIIKYENEKYHTFAVLKRKELEYLCRFVSLRKARSPRYSAT